MITNPVLQHHYRVIQAIALQEAEPTAVEDTLQPDEEGMARHGALIAQFSADAKELGDAALAEMEPAAPRKRKTATDSDKPKRVKAEEPDYASIDWQQQLNNDTLKKLTVPTLKVHTHCHAAHMLDLTRYGIAPNPGPLQGIADMPSAGTKGRDWRPCLLGDWFEEQLLLRLQCTELIFDSRHRLGV